MMNQSEARRLQLSAPTEKEAAADHTRALRDHSRPNSANASLEKGIKRFLIKRQEKGGT